jgi:hypothetical protein
MNQPVIEKEVAPHPRMADMKLEVIVTWSKLHASGSRPPAVCHRHQLVLDRQQATRSDMLR